jgi:hypothetical protein
MEDLKKLQQQVGRFNNTYSIGDKVNLKTPEGIKLVTVKEKATILYGHSAVGWFNEVSGCYSLKFVIN